MLQKKLSNFMEALINLTLRNAKFDVIRKTTAIDVGKILKISEIFVDLETLLVQNNLNVGVYVAVETVLEKET